MRKFDETDFEIRRLSFIYEGLENTISLPIYREVQEHFSGKNPEGYCNLSEYYLDYLSSTTQRHYLNTLIEAIWERTDNLDNQARIAITIVQRLPYDFDKSRYEMKYNPYARIRYPYEVFADNKGICCEKSLLLAFLFRECGFGVALFIFDEENHMAVGIKCPKEFGFYNADYAFIETTVPSIATDNQSYYLEVNKLGLFRKQLKSIPRIIPLCDGLTFNSIHQEFFDAKEWNELQGKFCSESGYYEKRRRFIIQKYGL